MQTEVCPGGLRCFCLQNCSNQSIHCSCCTASASAAGWQLTWPCTSRVMGTSTYKSKPGPSSKDASRGTERWSLSYLSMSIPPKQGKLFLLLKKTAPFLWQNGASWWLSLEYASYWGCLRISFESFYIKTLLKMTEEMLFCIPCLYCWYYFSDFVFAKID